MANLQKTLDSLQPYVIGIRKLEGATLVDVVFKEGWTIPDDPTITKVTGSDEMNYVMIYSQVDGVGLDELLEYVEKVIKMNQEREKKHELLKLKVNELKEIFKKYPLNKLKNLKFKFDEEELVPSFIDFDLDENPITKEENVIEEEIISESETHTAAEIINTPYLDADGNPIVMTPEEIEMYEEDLRAEKNRLAMANKGSRNPIVNAARKIDLPPKRSMVVANDRDYESDCDCGPHEACDKCIDKKDL